MHNAPTEVRERFEMNTQRITVITLGTILAFSTGCGALKDCLYGIGAPCSSCAPTAPCAMQPCYNRPYEPGCGGETYMEPGCGGEGYGSYYGGTPLGESVIGMPMPGMGQFGPSSSNPYIPSEWQPSGERIVPNSITYSDGVPVSPLKPIPSGQ